ncbi:MAG TPA: hypothetical protein VFE14_15640, partial [Micromonosporaceae bacterium]|nr:hypothetical protein [Micromonosporaceae bacterium]
MQGASRTYRSTAQDEQSTEEWQVPAAEPVGGGRRSRRRARRDAGGDTPVAGGTSSGGPTVPPRRRRDPLWAKLFIVFGALLMMGSGGVIVGAKILIGEATSNITQTPMITGEAGAG